MALCITDNHTLYYYMDAYRSIILGCSNSISLDNLVVPGWIKATLLHPDNTELAGSIVYHLFKFFPEELGMSLFGMT